MRLAAWTGMRRGEVLGLRWKDIDLAASTLSVRQTLLSTGYKTYFDSTKSHKARTIVLDPKTVKMLKRRRAAQNEERLVERTALQRITLHGLRHTHATLMLKAGISP